jgi:hypothetical protein
MDALRKCRERGNPSRDARDVRASAVLWARRSRRAVELGEMAAKGGSDRARVHGLA